MLGEEKVLEARLMLAWQEASAETPGVSGFGQAYEAWKSCTLASLAKKLTSVQRFSRVTPTPVVATCW